MTCAAESTDIISKHLPGVSRVSTDLPCRGKAAHGAWGWALCSVLKTEPGSRPPSGTHPPGRCPAAGGQSQTFRCQAKVIRRWLRLSLCNGSIAHLVLRPDGGAQGPGTRGSCLQTRSLAPGPPLASPMPGSGVGAAEDMKPHLRPLHRLRWVPSFL